MTEGIHKVQPSQRYFLLVFYCCWEWFVKRPADICCEDTVFLISVVRLSAHKMKRRSQRCFVMSMADYNTGLKCISLIKKKKKKHLYL